MTSEVNEKMKLGEQLVTLRKENKLSQEQLAEKIGVTRQTISNWELGETAPNPEQLKLLSQIFHVSIDKLLGNDHEAVLVEKISNTERLAGIIIKILKGIGILLILYLVLAIISFFLFNTISKSTSTSQSFLTATLECTLDEKNYTYFIESDREDNIIEASGSEYINELLEKENFTKGKMMVAFIEAYFEEHGGSCN